MPNYFKEEDVADRLYFGGKRSWWAIKHQLIGEEGKFGSLKITYLKQNGEVDDVLLLKVYIKNREEMEQVTKRAIANIRKLFQEIILFYTG